jgi:hypothetical protein
MFELRESDAKGYKCYLRDFEKNRFKVKCYKKLFEYYHNCTCLVVSVLATGPTFAGSGPRTVDFYGR